MTFTSVGAIGTMAHFAVLIFAVERLNLSVLTATTSGFVTGMVTNYLLNYHVTFKCRTNHVQAFSRFLSVAAIGLCINALLVVVLKVWLHYFVCQLIASAAVLFWNFIFNHCWTFKETGHARE